MPRRSLPRSRPDEEAITRMLELAGMMDGDGGSKIGRRVQTALVVRPAVISLDQAGEHLLYDTRVPRVGDVPKPDALDSFVALVGAPAETVLAFARRYGVLDTQPLWEPGVYAEPLTKWQYWATRARAILAVAAALHQEEPVPEADWQLIAPARAAYWLDLYQRNATHLPPEKRVQLSQRITLLEVLNDLLIDERVRPCFPHLWDGELMLTNLTGWFDEGGLSLSGYLAIQLGLACSRAESIATCSGCQVPYLRRWHSPKGRRNYCEACGKRAAWRDSKRMQRATKRSRNASRKARTK